MCQVPIAPSAKESLESDFDIVDVDDCIPGNDTEIFDKLEEDLLKQAKVGRGSVHLSLRMSTSLLGADYFCRDSDVPDNSRPFQGYRRRRQR